ncbi:MAG: HAD-IA family hydrolase, partial [Pseudorhodoplanes sp.]
TLVDSQHMIVAAMSSAYEAHGMAIPPRETMLSIVGLSLVEAFTALGKGAEGYPVRSLAEGYKTAFHALREGGAAVEPLYPGAATAIESLARRGDVALGIATGKSQRGVRLVLGHHGLIERFITIKTADDAPSKPDPGMLLNAMRETGAAPRDTVMIGDTSFDMQMARAAGVAAIGVDWGYHPADLLRASGAERVLSGYGELEAALDGLLFAREIA